jgi:hypothetical protein
MNEAASSVEPEVKTRFSTVDDAAFEKLLYEKEAQSRRYGHSDRIYVKKFIT